MDQESFRLEEHLNKLGYETQIEKSQPSLRHADPRKEIESRKVSPMVHMDVKA